MDNKRLYDNVKALCSATGIRMGDVECKAGVNPGYISRFARDKIKNVRLDVILAFADVFAVSVEDLVYKDFAKELEEKERQKEIDALEKRLKELKNGQ